MEKPKIAFIVLSNNLDQQMIIFYLLIIVTY